MFEYSAICDFVMMNLASVLALAVALNSNLLNFVPLKWHLGLFQGGDDQKMVDSVTEDVNEPYLEKKHLATRYDLS